MGSIMNSTDYFAPSPSAASKPSSIGSSVIPIINKLQDILTPIGGDLSKIQLPQVAVIGSQSSGKSSVLEALVGCDFLPRGSGICTRRPLVLQLVNRSDSDDRREWGEFLHLPGQLFHDFSKIRSEIQAETGREAGYNKGVSDKQIRLKISSPNVLNITLVDLPGITKVPVGDQPSDIEARIRKMIMSYIKQEACIILAVSPANSDLATSDALQMAKEADPAGSRTIGVITKLDIMDRGTNARDFLLGKVVPLHLGYVGVVNRSQEDINKNRSILEALAYEEQFFRDNPVYGGLSVCCGIPQLAKKLNQILEQHIRMVLPGLKAELNSHLLTVGKELRTYGEVMESKADQGAVLLNILTKYCEAFSALVDGRSQEIAAKELSGGARIKYIFQSMFVKSLEDMDPCEDFTDEDIRTAIQNATGPKHTLFVPEVPFEVLVRTQIARLLHPSLQCLQLVHDELLKMSRTCETIEIQRFPILRHRLDEVIGKFLLDGLKPAERMIEGLIEIEMAYINSSHPNFIGGNKAVELATQQLKSSQGNRPQSNNDKPALAGNLSTRAWAILGRVSFGDGSTNRSPGGTVQDIEQMPSHIQLGAPPAILKPPEIQTDNEAVEVMVTKLLLKSYFDIVRKNVQDLIPKAIMHYMVNNMKRGLLNALIQKLYSERHEEMLQEEDEVVMKRKQTSERFHIMQQAVQTLDEFEADVSSRSSSSGTDTSKKIPLSKSRVPGMSHSGQQSSPGRSKQKQ